MTARAENDCRRFSLVFPAESAVTFRQRLMPFSIRRARRFRFAQALLNLLKKNRLTRVTRIFEKKVFTKLRQPPGRETAPGFLLRGRKLRPRRAFFLRTQKGTSHAV
jgi:hypothetical protein